MSNYKIFNGDVIEELYKVAANSIDSVIIDSRYIKLNLYNRLVWEEILRCLKPGAMMLFMCADISSYRLTCYIEDIGFEVRDSILWLYKSNEFSCNNIQPSFNNIIMFRKPTPLTIIDNVDKYDIGGLNIDECRVGDEYIDGGTAPDLHDVGVKQKSISGVHKLSFGQVRNAKRVEYEGHTGRFPANTILTYGEEDFDDVCGGFPNSRGSRKQNVYTTSSKYGGNSLLNSSTPRLTEQFGYGDDGCASRYYYCANRSYKDDDYNTPINLFQYLIRLINPNGATILEPFMNNMNIGKATMYENVENNKHYTYLGITNLDNIIDLSKLEFNKINNMQTEISDHINNSKDDQKAIICKQQINLF